jgi:hypothetical protein
MSRIEYLLDKYSEGKYVKNMYESSKSRQCRYKKHLLHERLNILDTLLLEDTSKLCINKNEKEQAQYLIKFVDRFDDLHPHAKTEVIILAIIVYVMKRTRVDVRYYRWSISKKYGLTCFVYADIVSNLLALVLNKFPLPIIPTTAYDHSILEKQSL